MSALFGIVGWPLGHSRSAAIQGAAFAAAGIDALYLTFAVPPARLAPAVRGLGALGACGFNVTLPHKRSVLPLLDEVEVEARDIGAVNTVVRQGDRLVGVNTDAPGLLCALGDAGFDPAGSEVVILGGGGAARAATAALARGGAARIVVAARRPGQAEALVRDLSRAHPTAHLEATSLKPGDLEAAFRGAGLVVQASRATMQGKPGAAAFAAALPLSLLDRGATVTDLVYAPRETSVLRAARAQGLKAVDGLGMLVHQGALAFERWTGHEASRDAMRAAL